MRVVLTMFLTLTLVALVGASLVACESPQAQRLNAEARLISAEAARAQALADAESARIQAEAEARAAQERARGEADAERMRARAELEASLAASRQMERDASHERWIQTLTTLGLIVLPLSLVASIVAIILTNLRRKPDPVTLLLLDERRQLWHALAQISRNRRLPNPHEIIVYTEVEKQ